MMPGAFGGVIVSGREVALSGTVGDLGMGEFFTAADVRQALASVGAGPVTFKVNSGGGIATEGAAIHSVIAAHEGRKTVVVEGVAASAASILAMAGDDVVMALGAIMMVHDPSGLTIGTAADHDKSVESLNTLAVSMAGIYAEKTGRPVATIRQEMRDERWMTADEAVAARYANRAEKAGKATAPRAFNFRGYRHAPDRLVAMADANGWGRLPTKPATAATPPAPAVRKVTAADMRASMERELAKVASRSPEPAEVELPSGLSAEASTASMHRELAKLGMKPKTAA